MHETLARLFFIVQFGSTFFMVGVIWFVQVVHYPLFAKIGSTEFPEYERAHTSQTTWVVAPPMLLELGTASLLLWFRPKGISDLQCSAGLGLVLLIWISTVLLQVPYHAMLSKGFDPLVHRMLLSTNRLRTAAWTLRGFLVLSMAWSMKAEVLLIFHPLGPRPALEKMPGSMMATRPLIRIAGQKRLHPMDQAGLRIVEPGGPDNSHVLTEKYARACRHYS